MRKILALAMMALLALTIAFAAVGCGQKASETTTSETTPPPDAMTPDSIMVPDSSMVPDTTQH